MIYCTCTVTVVKVDMYIVIAQAMVNLYIDYVQKVDMWTLYVKYYVRYIFVTL